jgi:hypothetical protein
MLRKLKLYIILAFIGLANFILFQNFSWNSTLPAAGNVCMITQAFCPIMPNAVGGFEDIYGRQHHRSHSSMNACLARADDYYNWCSSNNPKTMKGNTVTANFYTDGTLVGSKTKGGSCRITLERCPAVPYLDALKVFEDEWGDQNANASTSQTQCLERASSYYAYCGNKAQMGSASARADYYLDGEIRGSKTWRNGVDAPSVPYVAPERTYVCATPNQTLTFPHGLQRNPVTITNCAKSPGKVTIKSDGAGLAYFYGSVSPANLGLIWTGPKTSATWRGKVVNFNRPVYTIGPFVKPIRSFFHRNIHKTLARSPNVADLNSLDDQYFPIQSTHLREQGGCQADGCIVLKPNGNPTSALQQYGVNPEVFALLRGTNWSVDRLPITWAGTTVNDIAIQGDIRQPQDYGQYLLPAQDYGVILVNSLPFLDAAGEWFYNPEDKMVYFIPEDGKLPSHEQSEFVLDDDKPFFDLQLAGGSPLDVDIRDISVGYNAHDGIRVSGARDVKLASMKLYAAGRNGITINDVKSFEVYSVEIKSSARTGLAVQGASGISSVTDSSFYSNGRIWEQDNIGQYLSGLGVFDIGGSLVIARNTFRWSGYAGIHTNNLTGLLKIENNDFRHSCGVLNDCAELYIGNYDPNHKQTVGQDPASRVVRNNYFVTGLGDTNGTPPGNPHLAAGIYIDFGGSGYTLDSNTIENAHSANGGIQINATKNLIVTNNGVYSNHGPALMLSTYPAKSCNDAKPESNSYSGNIFRTSDINSPVVTIWDPRRDCYAQIKSGFSPGNNTFIQPRSPTWIFDER